MAFLLEKSNHTKVKQPKFNLRGFVNIIKIPKAIVILDYYSI